MQHLEYVNEEERTFCNWHFRWFFHYSTGSNQIVRVNELLKYFKSYPTLSPLSIHTEKTDFLLSNI